MESTATPRRRSDRAEQLAAVAAELFCARGFSEVGIADIAAAAGVTGPAIYRHFDDKQSILAHVVLAGIDEMVASTELALDVADAPEVERVASVLTRLATLAVDRRDVAVLWRWEQHNLDADQQREVAKRAVDLIGRWARVLRGVRPDVSDDDAELLCWAALSVFGSVAVHNTRIGKRRYVELLVDRAHAVLHCELPSSSAAATAAAAPIVQQSRREQLIVAAGRLFGARGFREVSIGDVGAAVGIAGPSVYRHFPSKTALLVGAAHRLAQRLDFGRAQVAAVATTEAEALRGLVESYVDTMSDCPGLLAQARQVSTLPAAERTELLRVQKEYVAEWVRLLRGVRPDLPPADARVIVHMALTIANDLLGTRRVQQRPHLHAELVALMSAVLGLA